MTGILRVPRRAALVTIAVLVAGASLVSFAESYHALYLWAARHGAGGNWALIWPAMVDVFIAVGELSLFVAMIDRWQSRDRALAWVVTLAGLAVSVAGNVGHVASGAAADRVTAAVPPLAATAALAVGLGVLKRVARLRHSGATSLPHGGGNVAPNAAPASHDVAELSQADAIRLAIAESGSRDPGEVAAWLEQNGGRVVARQRISDVVRRDGRHRLAAMNGNGGAPHA